MEHYSATAALRWGWQRFMERPIVFFGFTVILFLVSSLISSDTSPKDAYAAVTLIASVVVGVFLDMGATAFMLKAHDSIADVSLWDLWHPEDFLNYLLAALLTGLVVGVGLFLLVIPGIVAAIALLFVKLLVIDRHLGPVEAFKESVRITKGHRLELFVLILLVALIDLAGVLLLGIGLLVAIPVTTLAVTRSYRVLMNPEHEVVPAAL